MTQYQHKKIGAAPVNKTISKLDTLKDTWAVVKPFVKFSFKAMQVIAHALMFIVKHIPKPEESGSKREKTGVIRVNKRQ